MDPKTDRAPKMNATEEADLLEEAKAAFALAEEAEAENRRDQLDDIKFARLSEQWDEAIRTQREAEQRPCLTINKLPPFIRQVVNDGRQNKPSIKVHPVDDQADVETAEIYNGIIRNIEYSSNAPVAYDTALDSAVTGGLGYWRVRVDYAHNDTFDLDLKIERIANPFCVYGDPYSEAADSADWNSAFVTASLTKHDFTRKWKKAKPFDWSSSGYMNLSGPWFDGKTVQVVEYWTREEDQRHIVLLSDGTVRDADRFRKWADWYAQNNITVTNERITKGYKVRQHILTGAEVLETNRWEGQYIPIVPVYGEEVNVEGKRYFRSLVRDAKDAQRMFNYWRSAATELVALAPRAPFIGPVGAFKTDAKKWQTANTNNHPYLQYDGKDAPQRQPFAGPPGGALQEALNASDDLKAIMGIYDASLGARSNETSGRAILARQREGDVSTFHFIDNLSRAINHTGRILIDMIPRVYTPGRIVRVLGPDGKEAKTVKLGERTAPTQPGDAEGGEGGERAEAIAKVFDLTAGRYDLTVTTGPNFTTQREEAATQMMEMVRAYPAVAPLIMDLLVKNLDWPGADEIAERLTKMLPPQLQGESPEAQQAQQQMKEMAGQLTALKAQLDAAASDRASEDAKVEVDRYKAATDRLKVLQGALSPEAYQMLLVNTLREISGIDITDDPAPPQPMPGGPMPGGAPPMGPEAPMLTA
jgi:hypothetical protein